MELPGESVPSQVGAEIPKPHLGLWQMKFGSRDGGALGGGGCVWGLGSEGAGRSSSRGNALSEALSAQSSHRAERGLSFGC